MPQKYERTPQLTYKNLDRELPRLTSKQLSQLYEGLDDIEADADPAKFPEFRRKVSLEFEHRKETGKLTSDDGDADSSPEIQYDDARKNAATSMKGQNKKRG